MKTFTIHLFLLFTFLTMSTFGQENTALTCADGIDNDNDTLIDCNDPDCQNLGSNNGCELCTDGITFADVLIDYNPGCDNADPDPEGAIGLNDFVSGDPYSYVYLGQGGSIKLGFTNNLLTNSGTEENDVYVFEIGPQVEASDLAIRPADAFTETQLINNNLPDIDDDGFYEIGSISGSIRGFDIDAVITGYSQKTLKFNAIQITDIPNGSCSSTTPGADIDAVCALSSFTLSTSNNSIDKDFLKIYPNPAQNKINLHFSNNNHDLTHYNLVNLSGQILQKGLINNKREISTENLESGVYFLSIKGTKTVITKKIFKL
ncbi:T9SS type A sorting domain-containing protein [Algibacter sp. AS12]|uniref:T9SS type A sorting domain-containing protein n=1 Tax=Algibacter sp. AS12 TaxID=3135773 RepID=UPI00398B396B